MEVILLEKVTNLGDIGDKVNVKSGYARNFLVPQGIAKLATKENLAEFAARRAELERIAAEKLQSAQKRAEKLTDFSVTIAAHAGDEGKLFGSIGAREIVEAAKAAGVEITKSEVRLPTGAIRVTGEYDITLHLHTDVDATIKVIVEPDLAL